tara:strand:+ start:3193 stop:3717 length:525 start_codon:yes stop_codon:yes gene_type:complete
MGVYAKRNIPKGVEILDYVGTKVTKKQSDKIADDLFKKYEHNKEKFPGVFIFELDKKYDIDGNVKYNTARFINHSCSPNCEVEIEKGRIWIQSIKKIKKGEELFYNYGYDIDDHEDHPCYCGSKKCVGYILDEDLWPRLKKKIAAKKKKERLAAKKKKAKTNKRKSAPKSKKKR